MFGFINPHCLTLVQWGPALILQVLATLLRLVAPQDQDPLDEQQFFDLILADQLSLPANSRRFEAIKEELKQILHVKLN